MTLYEENRTNMFDTVLGVFNSNVATLTEFPELARIVTEFKTLVVNIRTTDEEYTKSTPGKTAEKNLAIDAVLMDLLPVKAALYSYACTKKNQELKSLTSITESQLKTLSNAQFLKKAEIITTAAKDVVSELGPYTITEERLTELSGKIDKLKASRDKKSTGFTQKSALRKSLTALFNQAEDMLQEHLDILIELVRPKYLQLYNQFKAARVVKDVGGGRGGKKNDGDDNPQNPEPPK